jgi:UDP-glucose-4-epimerase GalE
MLTVAVTGGAGYIGSHTCKALAAVGIRPIVIDNMSYGHRWAVKWGPLEEGDIRDPAFLDAVFAKWKPSAVIHFAGLIQVGESVQRPDLYYDSNVRGTLTLLDRMRANGIGRIVFSSTCAIFGLPDRMPLHEDLPFAPINPYGASKAMVEQLLRDYSHAFGLRAVALRYFNAAGADPDGQIGEAHDPESHLIPLTIEVALGTRPHLSIFGADYPSPDGTCIRDYVHVNDLADAHVRALTWLDQNDGFAAFNLGNGSGYTVRQVIDSVERVSGKPVPAVISARRPGDPPALVADSAKAASGLGWRPAMPGLDDIVRSAWNWHSRSAEITAKD